VKREAPPGQWLERRSVAPVQSQKATRFAGRRASQPCPFDDDGPDPAATQEISDRGADDAATAYKDPHSFTRPHTEPPAKPQAGIAVTKPTQSISALRLAPNKKAEQHGPAKRMKWPSDLGMRSVRNADGGERMHVEVETLEAQGMPCTQNPSR
jgi:hypothetical protein